MSDRMGSGVDLTCADSDVDEALIEELGERLLDEVGVRVMPVDPRGLAAALDLQLVPSTQSIGGCFALIYDTIYYDGGAQRPLWREQIARALAAWWLHYLDMEVDDARVRHMGRVLLMPRESVDLTLGIRVLAQQFDVPELMAAQRIAELRTVTKKKSQERDESQRLHSQRDRLSDVDPRPSL